MTRIVVTNYTNLLNMNIMLIEYLFINCDLLRFLKSMLFKDQGNQVLIILAERISIESKSEIAID
jgi:hypothetical protein